MLIKTSISSNTTVEVEETPKGKKKDKTKKKK